MFVLDRNVMQNLGATGNANVRKWLAGIDDTEVFLPVMAVVEGCYGYEKKRNTDLTACEAGLAAIAGVVDIFGDRVLDLDRVSAATWAHLMAVHGRGQLGDDMCYVAVAMTHGACLVTRNFKHMQNKGADVLDPFTDPPTLG